MNRLLINPYTVGPPVVSGRFYGRSKLLNQVHRALQSTNVVLLQGQRRIGKTSFLKHLAHLLLSEQSELSELSQKIPVMFDIQRYVQDTLPQFQFHLAATIIRASKHVRNQISNVPDLSDFEADTTLFQDKWLPQIHEQLGNQELVILVDEFDNFDEQFAPQAIRSLVPFIGQLVSGETWLRWVFALGRLTGEVSLEYDSIVRRGEEFRLTFFSPEEARKLIVEPAEGILDYHANAIERIYSLTNGQPHLTQAVCSKIFEYSLENNFKIVTLETVLATTPQVLEAYGSAIASIISVPPVEEKVLIAIAKLESSEKIVTRDQVIKLLVDNGVRLNRDDLSNALNSLLEWELLKGNSETLQISIELVQHWLLQNRFLEPSQKENLDIQYSLAQSRFVFAEQAFHAGLYDLAINDYNESLNYIPSNSKALRGLAEAYRLSHDSLNRVETLKKLYFYDQNTLNELSEAIEKYAKECEQKGEFSSAAQQYDFLFGLHRCERWRRSQLSSLINHFKKRVANLANALKAYRKKQEYLVVKEQEYLVVSELDNSDFFDEIRDVKEKLEEIEDQSLLRYHSPNETSPISVKYDDQYDLESNSLIKEIEERNLVSEREKAIQRRITQDPIRIMRKKGEAKFEQLRQLTSEIKVIEQEIKDLILEGELVDLDLDKDSFNCLEREAWLLSIRVQIELAKLNDDFSTASQLLRDLDKAGEKLNEEDEDLLLLAVLNRFKNITNSFKVIFVLLFIGVYLAFISWLIKDWYIQAFTALITGGLVIAALIIPFIFWGLTEGLFLILRGGILRIMRKFRLRILDLANSDLHP